MVAHLDMEAWPAPIARMFLGQMTAASVSRAAKNARPPDLAIRACEADFHAGEYTIGRGGKAEVIRLLRRASTDCPKDQMEWFAARVELTRLGEGPE